MNSPQGFVYDHFLIFIWAHAVLTGALKTTVSCKKADYSIFGSIKRCWRHSAALQAVSGIKNQVKVASTSKKLCGGHVWSHQSWVSPISGSGRIWFNILKNLANGMPDSSDIISSLACHWLDFSGYCIISWNLNLVNPDSDLIAELTLHHQIRKSYICIML